MERLAPTVTESCHAWYPLKLFDIKESESDIIFHFWCFPESTPKNSVRFFNISRILPFCFVSNILKNLFIRGGAAEERNERPSRVESPHRVERKEPRTTAKKCEIKFWNCDLENLKIISLREGPPRRKMRGRVVSKVRTELNPKSRGQQQKSVKLSFETVIWKI